MLLLFAFCLTVQAVETKKPEEPAPAALERIRRALEGPDLEIVDDGDRQVFRIYIRERSLPAQLPWTDDTPRPEYVQTRFPLFHHEFLESVTPEEFRAGTLYPIGIDVISVVNAAMKAMRKRAHQRAEAEAAARGAREGRQGSLDRASACWFSGSLSRRVSEQIVRPRRARSVLSDRCLD
jgi:hypothetical protein